MTYRNTSASVSKAAADMAKQPTYAELMQQRNDLLIALENMLDHAINLGSNGFACPIAQARFAITKATS